MTKEIFSVYRPPISSATIPVKSLDLDSIWEGITDGTLKDQTTSLRLLLREGRITEYKESKGNLLPSVPFGGVFDYRHTDPQKYRGSLIKKLEEETDPVKISKYQKTIGLLEGKTGLQSSSGLVIIDIDHISETGLSLEELRDRLSTDSQIGVRLIFVSPSGDGLKVVCKTSAEITDPQSYKSVFESLRYYINTNYGEIVDKSGSDVSRLCLLCYDPSAILKGSDWKYTFDPALHPVQKKERERRPEYTLQEIDSYFFGEDGIEEIVQRVESSRIDIAPEYGDYIKLVYSFTALGERGRSLLHRVCSLSTKYNPEDTDRDFDNCSSSGESQSIGTFINMCKDMGIDVSKPVERPQSGKDSQRSLSTSTIRANQKKEETPVQTEEDLQKQREEKFSKYLQIPSLSEIVSTKREGIKTKYKFGEDKGKEEYLTLRSGAMTMICGKSSHCKSKLLQNLALQISEDMYNRQEEGSVLFFTYEEELSDVLIQFANIKTNTPGLSKFGTPNTEVIQEYLSKGEYKCTQENRIKLQSGVSQFRTLWESGQIRVYYTDMSSQSLCEVIRYLSSKIKVKAVFVDYIQLLHKDNFRGDKREEIAEICNDLRTTAIDLGLPLVLSAQLNRLADSPTDMSEDNIAESADITRYANTIVCLWNSYFDNVSKGYKDSAEYKLLQSRGFNLGEGGKLFAKITKNRGGTPYVDTILDFIGETGCIPAHEEQEKGKETFVSSLLDMDDLPE